MKNLESTGDLKGSVVLFMALAAALGTSTIYLLQPAIADVSASIHTNLAMVGVAFAFGPIGYMVGLLTLVPLVDRFQPKNVLAIQFLLLGLALLLTAFVQDIALLALLIGVTGACSVVGAGMSSIAGKLTAHHRRATNLGIVTAGISVGILAGRIIGGWLADYLGWREMLMVFAVACVVVAICCRLVLPTSQTNTNKGYLAGLASLPGLFLSHSVLRLAAFRGALWFFSFCAVWSGLAVALSKPPFSFSAERIGLYALAGLSGVFATRIAGVWTDKVGARRVILIGLFCAGCSSLIGGLVLPNTVATLLGLALFDAGLFAAQVANQSTVLAIDPTSPARFNSAYMMVYFVGGTLGTMFGAAAVEWFGWTMNSFVATALITVAALFTWRARGSSVTRHKSSNLNTEAENNSL